MALFLPVFFAMGAVVLDVGNWYVHKRHLQTQVDAAALAGGTKFTGCSSLFDPAAANLAIKGTALEYAGDDLRAPDTIDPTFGSTVRNQQVEQPGDVRVVINSSDYWSQGDPTDGSSLDDTQDLDGDGSGDPCNERAVDAKATDDEVPNIFGVSWGGFVPLHPSPKSHARVEIHQVLEENGMLPFAVPEIDPAAVYAIFVNEINGAIVGTQKLCKLPSSATCTAVGSAPNSNFSYWSTSTGQNLVNIPTENTGVVILISKNATTVAMPGSLPAAAPALANLCSSSPGLIRCHGNTSPTGVNFIHGWSDAPGGHDIASGPGTPRSATSV